MCVYSAHCMHVFKAVLRYNIDTRGKNRLIVLMMLDSPAQLDTGADTVVLRQYLRQFKYIDYMAADWRDRLLYGLPLHPMDQRDDDDVPLLPAP